MSKKKKYYVVWIGQKPGIYDSWAKCQEQTRGFPNAKYKSFTSLKEAETAFKGSAQDHINLSKKKKTSNSKITSHSNEINYNSISVDAACSGNPGIMEYRGVVTKSGEQLFKSRKYNDGTNNIGEFLAIIHGIVYLQKQDLHHVIIYTDSRTALAWIRNKKVKTTLDKSKQNEVLFEHIEKSVKWLKNNSFKNPLIKWETKRWGEIPADFGRK